MKKVLITCGADPEEITGYYQLFKLAEPTFQSYADRWGFEYRSIWFHDIHAEKWPGIISGREPRWKHNQERTAPYYLKIPAVAEMLEEYDLVFYMDSDCCILDDRRNIEDALPEGKELGFNDLGYGPFASVSLTRRSDLTRKFWRGVWDCEAWRTCKWYDNAGVQSLLGYTTDTEPMVKICDTEYTPIFQKIGEEWIAEGKDNPGVPEAGRVIFHLSYGQTAYWKIENMSRALASYGKPFVPVPQGPALLDPIGYVAADSLPVQLSHGRRHL